MKKIKEVFRSKYLKIGLIFSVIAAVFCVGAFAEGEQAVTSASISTAMQTALQTTVNDTLTMISGLLPIGLSVVGVMLVVSMGIKAFKKITGKA